MKTNNQHLIDELLNCHHDDYYCDSCNTKFNHTLKKVIIDFGFVMSTQYHCEECHSKFNAAFMKQMQKYLESTLWERKNKCQMS